MTGMEPLWIEVAKSLTGLVLKTAWEMGNKPIEPAFQQTIYYASQQYIQNYTKRHGILKVLGMREPISLERVYADVQFLGANDIRCLETPEQLEQAFRASKQRGFQYQSSPKQDGLAVAKTKQYLMVLGGPGTGKSTFLRRVGLEALRGKRGKFAHACMPVFLALSQFNHTQLDFAQAIAKEFEICGFPKPDDTACKLLAQGKLLILLDGLDEVATDRMPETIRQIQDFVDQHDKNRFIASCRVAAYRHNFRRFSDVQMADFDDKQIQQFITNWFHYDPSMAQECWAKLNTPDHHAAKELTQTPLLLTLICLLYQRSRKFPTNRATVYERALRVLLEEWAAEKGIPQEDVYKGLDTKRKELLLAEIAYHGFAQDCLFLPRREIAHQIEQLLKELLPQETVINGAEVLRAIEVQHGVLVERAEGIYSFSHLTLQEYLTAQYIDDHHQLAELVSHHVTDQRWREVFLLVAGLMRGGADALLLLMEQQAQKKLGSPKFQALLQWSHQATQGSPGNYKSSAKRVFALALDLALALDRALDRARKLQQVQIFTSVNYTVLIARLSALQQKIPDRHLPIEMRRAFVEQVRQTWFTALQLDPTWLDLSWSEAEALEQYFYIAELMVRCKEQAVRVSPQVWEAIESRLAMPMPESPE